MAQKRVILELGTGNDLHGGDYTKAALRAVQDALHHSLARHAAQRSRSIPRPACSSNVTIGVQQPDKVDLEKVRASLPHGIVTVKAVKGGLDVADPENNDPAVIAQRRGRGPAGAAVMLLYEHPLSSYAQKVKIALREKGLDFDGRDAAGAGLGQGRRAVRRGQPAQRGAGADRRRGAHLRFDHHPRISRGQVSPPRRCCRAIRRRAPRRA